MQLNDAFSLASEIHQGVKKNGTSYPYLYHPLAVASLVLKYGGTEAQVRAALLHDTIGDARVTRELIRVRFGAETERLVYTFADPEVEPEVQNDWLKLRHAYLAKLGRADEDALLVVACEELHELSELVSDLRRLGPDTWQRYPVPASSVFWYFREILVLCNRLLTAERYRPLVSEYGTLLRQFKTGLFD